MVTIISTAVVILSATETAYQIVYSEGTQVRAVESADGWIRKEWLKKGVWTLVGKPYVVKSSKGRNAERIRDIVKAAQA